MAKGPLTKCSLPHSNFYEIVAVTEQIVQRFYVTSLFEKAGIKTFFLFCSKITTCFFCSFEDMHVGAHFKYINIDSLCKKRTWDDGHVMLSQQAALFAKRNVLWCTFEPILSEKRTITRLKWKIFFLDVYEHENIFQNISKQVHPVSPSQKHWWKWEQTETFCSDFRWFQSIKIHLPCYKDFRLESWIIGRGCFEFSDQHLLLFMWFTIRRQVRW